ncbi:MAG: ECF-type sigma factor, partial [Desulfomonilaceae bacterium]
MMQIERNFVEQIRDVLNHLYDYPYLQAHALADSLKPGKVFTPRERMHFLRTAVLEAIEELNPGSDVPFRSLRARAYNVLNLRYVEGLTIEAIAHELALSERQVYRDLREAEEDVARLVFIRFCSVLA